MVLWHWLMLLHANCSLQLSCQPARSSAHCGQILSLAYSAYFGTIALHNIILERLLSSYNNALKKAMEMPPLVRLLSLVFIVPCFSWTYRVLDIPADPCCSTRGLFMGAFSTGKYTCFFCLNCRRTILTGKE